MTSPNARQILPMTSIDVQKHMQRYVANVAITPSAVRGRGSKGVASTVQQYLARLDLDPLASLDPATFRTWLDTTTNELILALPDNARKWGLARKLLNIFLVQSFLNLHLNKEHNLSRLGDALETPLDAMATRELRKRAGRRALPRWTTIRKLRPADSDRYQDFALGEASRIGIPRACLDIVLWRASSN